MLEQAIKFIREGKFPQAKELLTNLLRTDQNNAIYWVWLSAAMETQKERLYCLQMAYRADPANAAARRGLVLMGALNPDEGLTPFPMNHSRPWESKLKLADEKPKVTGIKRVTGNPLFRLAVIGVIVLAVLGGAIFGLGTLIRSNQQASGPRFIGTSRPTVTAPPNNKIPTPNPAVLPLATLLAGVVYTPTPIYAATPHADVALDAYRGAMRAYSQGRWDTVADMMAQVGTTQPGSVDTVYFIAEAKRLSGQYSEALDYYQEAIKINANFAPIYLGRARANLALNPKKAIIADLNSAISLDPNYTDAFMERGLYYLSKNDLPSAKSDLVQAAALNPNSPLIQLNLARLLLALGENEEALAAAKQAKELDVTMLDAYLVLGMAYQADEQIDQAVEVLDIYTQYAPNNAEAFTILASAYFNRGDYETALKNINQALQLDNKSSGAYRWRAEIHLATHENEKAVSDFKQAYRNGVSFEAGMGIGRAMIANDDFGNAYITIIGMEKLADTDQKRGFFLYYRAIALEKLNEQVAAYRDWTELLSLPVKATTEEMRTEAKARLVALKSATPPAPTATQTMNPTPTATRFPSLTTRPTVTRFPSITPTPTRTPKVSPTPTPTK